MTAVLVTFVVLAILAAALVGAAVRILREYERAVVFRFGRLTAVRGPGLIMLVPAVDRMVRVSLRTVTLPVPAQDIITRDNVPVRVDAVVYFRVVDAAASVVKVEDGVKATLQIAATTLRSILGKAELDALLAERERLNEDLQHIIDEQTEPWGIKVTAVEIKDVGIPAPMQRAMARQAEAERERRAKVIHAEGELQASATLTEAAGNMARHPTSLQLRYLQTLREIGVDQSTTVVFPVPLDTIRSLLGGGEPAGEPATGARHRVARHAALIRRPARGRARP
jgi:regulator of protease activity HflC (stomatin/prohibitin superfamily)